MCWSVYGILITGPTIMIKWHSYWLRWLIHFIRSVIIVDIFSVHGMGKSCYFEVLTYIWYTKCIWYQIVWYKIWTNNVIISTIHDKFICPSKHPWCLFVCLNYKYIRCGLGKSRQMQFSFLLILFRFSCVRIYASEVVKCDVFHDRYVFKTIWF